MKIFPSLFGWKAVCMTHLTAELQIGSSVMAGTSFIGTPDIDQILATNKDAFDRAQALIDKK